MTGPQCVHETQETFSRGKIETLKVSSGLGKLVSSGRNRLVPSRDNCLTPTQQSRLLLSRHSWLVLILSKVECKRIHLV